jgi:hypothetical protein
MASYIVANVAKVALQALQQHAQAHPTTAPIVQTPQDPSASTESVAGDLVQETTSLSLGPSSPSAVRASNDPSPETAEDILRSLHISECPRAGHYSPENPDLARQSVMSRQRRTGSKLWCSARSSIPALTRETTSSLKSHSVALSATTSISYFVL